MPGIDPISLATTGLGVLETGYGIIQNIKNKKIQNGLLAQETPYKTPQEIYDVLNATKANASQGYDPTTLNYLTTQTDNAFSSSVGAATRLGANPNDLSAIFGQKVDNIMQIGAQNHQLNMQNFSAYINALNSVAANKAAEQKSQQDIINNKLAATGVNLNTANQNISGGINTALAGLSAFQTAKLYNNNSANNSNSIGLLPDVTSVAPVGNLATSINTGGLAPMQMPVYNGN